MKIEHKTCYWGYIVKIWKGLNKDILAIQDDLVDESVMETNIMLIRRAK